MSKATTSGNTQVWGAGQEGKSYNVYFDQNSTSTISHDIQVDNDFFRVMAFNLATNESVTIEQVTGVGGTFVANYAPINNAIQLTSIRTSYVIERPGRYRLKLNASLGHVLVVGFQYPMENESTQDIVDSILVLASKFPLPLAVRATPSVTPDISGNVLKENVNISAQAGNIVVINSDGLYVPAGAATPCTIGALTPHNPTARNNVVSLDGSNCLVDQQFLSSDPTNLLQLRNDGAYYGIMAPITGNYVSSSLGSDTNNGTQASPYKTIKRAIQDFPQGTTGTIFLYRGDTFYIDPDHPVDTVITTLSTVQIAATRLIISQRNITFQPYADPAITTIEAYNTANNTFYNEFNNQQINFPIIKYQVYSPTDNPTGYIATGFQVDNIGSVTFVACSQVITQILLSNPFTSVPPIWSSGSVTIFGGSLTLSNFPYVGEQNALNTQQVFIRFCVLKDHVTPSTPLTFYQVNTDCHVHSDTADAGGEPIAPSVPALAAYTQNANNAPILLADISLWKNDRVINPSLYIMFRGVANFPTYNGINIQSGLAYSLISSDANKGILCTSLPGSGAVVITVPTNSSQPMTIGTKIYIEEIYAGGVSVSVSAAVGVTLNTPQGNTIFGANQVLELEKTATDTWIGRIY